MESVIDRFIRYIKIDTQSARNAESFPSTEKQLNLARLLTEELRTMGLIDAATDQYGYVTATLPSNSTRTDLPVVGFLAHMDTSPDFSGENVNPQFIENYDGDTVVLNRDLNLTMSPEEFPDLLQYRK